MIPKIRLIVDKNSYRLTGEGADIEIANRLLRAIELRGLSKHTVRSYGFDLVIIFRWMHQTERKLKALTDADLMDLIAAQRTAKAAAKTINRRLLVSRILYRYAYNKEIPGAPGVSRAARHYIGQKYDPYLGIFTVRRAGKLKLSVKDDSKLIEPLTAAQVNELLRLTTRYRDTLIVLLMLFCGLRSHEILSLRLASMDLRERSIRIMGKGRKERMLPLPDPVIALTEKYLRHERPATASNALFVILQGDRRGQPMTPTGLRSLFRIRRHREDLQKANAHRLRHTFGSNMAHAGVKLPVLQKMMGHAHPKTTLAYIQLSVADIREEYERAMERIQSRYDSPLHG